MQAKTFLANFRRRKFALIPRQSKRTVDGKPKGPNATEERYKREILTRFFPDTEITYEPDPIVITTRTKRVYTADFLTQKNGEMIYHEVKGSYHLPTHDRARLAWEIAAEKHPESKFVWAELTPKGWEIETWELGGLIIYVHTPDMNINESRRVNADWRRHKPRKISTRKGKAR